MILGGKACCGVNCFLNIVGLSDVAGGSVAYFDNIFAFLVHREIFVESCNAVKLGFAFVDLFRNIFQRVLRQEFILVLDLLHDSNDPGLIAVVFLQYAVDKAEINLYQMNHPFHTSFSLLHFNTLLSLIIN